MIDITEQNNLSNTGRFQSVICNIISMIMMIVIIVVMMMK